MKCEKKGTHSQEKQAYHSRSFRLLHKHVQRPKAKQECTDGEPQQKNGSCKKNQKQILDLESQWSQVPIGIGSGARGLWGSSVEGSWTARATQLQGLSPTRPRAGCFQHPHLRRAGRDAVTACAAPHPQLSWPGAGLQGSECSSVGGMQFKTKGEGRGRISETLLGAREARCQREQFQQGVLASGWEQSQNRACLGGESSWEEQGKRPSSRAPVLVGAGRVARTCARACRWYTDWLVPQVKHVGHLLRM